MILPYNNDPTQIFDKHFSLKCLHCQKDTSITAISIPRYEFLQRFRPEHVGIVYKCDYCLEPIFLKFPIERYDFDRNQVLIGENYQAIQKAIEDFEYEYLPEAVRKDFREAALCYSIDCYNAFAAMCRRTTQSILVDLGAEGKDKVKAQLLELKEMAKVDDETSEVLNQIIIEGHDGAHPHLPALSNERAAILLELMKDVLYQLYVRKGKLEKAAQLRRQQIEGQKIR